MTEMTEIAAKKHFRYRRKYFIFFQGKTAGSLPIVYSYYCLR